MLGQAIKNHVGDVSIDIRLEAALNMTLISGLFLFFLGLAKVGPFLRIYFLRDSMMDGLTFASTFHVCCFFI